MRLRHWILTSLCALLLLPVFATAAPHVYANGTLGANGWWRNPTGNVLTSNMNWNRISLTTSATVYVPVCWAYAPSVFRGVSLPCGWPGYWMDAVFGDYDGFHQVSDTYGGAYPMQLLCINGSPVNRSGYCSWYD